MIAASPDLTISIALLGFMGAGKSTAGQMLARELGVPFTDLDQLIETRLGLRIVEIFAMHGESYFRQQEYLALTSLERQPPRVVSLGGGTFCQPANTAFIQEQFCTIWLDCPLEELAARCLRDHPVRPLLRDERQFRELYNQRLPFYQQAQLRIPAGGQSISSVVTAMIEALRWKGLLAGPSAG